MSDAAKAITQQPGRAQEIIATVASWPGVEIGAHRFGGVEFGVSGWGTFPIKSPADVEAAVELFRLSYERAIHARSTASTRSRSDG